MSVDATLLLTALGRTTVLLAAAGIATALILKLSRAQWPAIHRLGWLLTLLVGWTFLRFPVAVPWYETPVEVDLAVEPLVEVAPLEPADAAGIIELAPPAPLAEPFQLPLPVAAPLAPVPQPPTPARQHSIGRSPRSLPGSRACSACGRYG